MINLIPPEGHRVIKREYVLRVGATYCFLFACISVLLTVALIPTYVLVGAQLNTLRLEVEKGSGGEEEFQKADEAVRITKDVLAQLKTRVGTVSMSNAINEVQNIAPSSITFKTFRVEESNGAIEKIQVQGVAPTREALARLRVLLEASSLFATAEVPIADLARDENLPFAITVTLSKE